MFRRDYFMRQIEQMTLALHRILFNKEHIPIGDAQQLLDEASRHLLGLNVKSLLALSSKDILELLTYQGNTEVSMSKNEQERIAEINQMLHVCQRTWP
ncbi:DUF6483 family protein [Paenibacillus sp. SI8]|uniref:DUF6483 family protein n=1 Tax=unclassified Paenibacillus TaxID=185978 RepID=UPI0034672B43